MTDNSPPRKSAATDAPVAADAPPRKPLSAAAQRALAEAEARRVAARESASRPLAKEIAGPEGLEPTRYGDWEKKGIASDF